jgi:hypothetical protein
MQSSAGQDRKPGVGVQSFKQATAVRQWRTVCATKIKHVAEDGMLLCKGKACKAGEAVFVYKTSPKTALRIRVALVA